MSTLAVIQNAICLLLPPKPIANVAPRWLPIKIGEGERREALIPHEATSGAIATIENRRAIILAREESQAVHDLTRYLEHEKRRISRSQELLEATRARYLRRCEEAAHILRDRYGARTVYVFGSVLRSDFDSGSDVDLAAEGVEGSDYFSALTDLADVFGFQPDLVRLETADPLLKTRILDEGRMINGSS